MTQVALLAAAVLALGACSATPSNSPTDTDAQPTAQPSAKPTEIAPRALNQRVIPAPSLEGNLLGEPAERELWIYLPPQYFESDAALPVAYYLPGFGETTINGVTMPGELDAAFATLDPMIIVVVSGVTAAGGSFYVDSPANGNWEQFITEDVVDYVDANFRTIPAVESRGIFGGSMGGFGALNLAMRHPDIFGAVYASTPGLLDDRGVAQMGFFDSDEQILETLGTLETASDQEGAAVSEALVPPNYISQLEFAYGLAFAPSTEPPYFAFPFTQADGELARDDAVMSTWDAGFGDWGAKVDEFRDNLAQLAGIGFVCASDDEFEWIPQGCVYLDAQLTDADIDHEYLVTTGGHDDATGARTIDTMLPFMAAHLAQEG